MKTITTTELARNLRAILDQVRETGEEYVVERGRQPVARVSPTPGAMTAVDALADLYQTLEPVAAESWARDARRAEETLSNDMRDPWGGDPWGS